jgi:excisionase family DNA binding protein
MDNPGNPKASEPELGEVLDADEAAVLLRVTPQTVRNLAAKGQLPGKKVGKEWRFSRSGLIAWLSEPPSAPASRGEPPGAE